MTYNYFDAILGVTGDIAGDFLVAGRFLNCLGTFLNINLMLGTNKSVLIIYFAWVRPECGTTDQYRLQHITAIHIIEPALLSATNNKLIQIHMQLLCDHLWLSGADGKEMTQMCMRKIATLLKVLEHQLIIILIRQCWRYSNACAASHCSCLMMSYKSHHGRA